MEAITPFPPLPTELVLDILAFAATESLYSTNNTCSHVSQDVPPCCPNFHLCIRSQTGIISPTNGKSFAASLSLISRQVRARILPLLFHTLVLNHRHMTFSLLKFLKGTPETLSLNNGRYNFGHHKYVKTLWMRQSTSTGVDIELILGCSKLERLAVTPSCFSALCQYGDKELEFLNIVSEDTKGPTPLEEDPGRKLGIPHELLLFPGIIDWQEFDTHLISNSYTNLLFSSLSHLWLTLESQLLALLQCPSLLSSFTRLSHLAAPLSKISVADVHRMFPLLEIIIITKAPRFDPGLDISNGDLDYVRLGRPLDWEVKRPIVVKLPDTLENEDLSMWRDTRCNMESCKL